MNRTTLRSASTGIRSSARKFGAGILMMGMALSASAKDGLPGGVAPQAPSVKPNPSAKPNANIRLRPGLKQKHWLQVGVASWYGSRFQGKKTAGGERFDMNRMTCAHRNLPLGTWLRVTNMSNQKTTFVRVNDRGPILEGRIVDLSYAAAQSLGLAGIGKVKLEPVSDGDPSLLQTLVTQLQMPMLLPAVR